MLTGKRQRARNPEPPPAARPPGVRGAGRRRASSARRRGATRSDSERTARTSTVPAAMIMRLSAVWRLLVGKRAGVSEPRMSRGKEDRGCKNLSTMMAPDGKYSISALSSNCHGSNVGFRGAYAYVQCRAHRLLHLSTESCLHVAPILSFVEERNLPRKQFQPDPALPLFTP